MTQQEHKPFETFRGADARDYGEHNIQAIVDGSPEIFEALGQFVRAGAGAGQQVSMVYSRPGFSLTHVWFKSGYPLPLHSHSGGCLYYILAGGIRIGTETYGAGDGFFVDSDVPYTYETGPEGVEVLEFRATDQMNIRFLAKNRKAWDKTIARLEDRREAWVTEAPPPRVPRPRRPRSTAPTAAVKARRKATRPA